MGNSSEKYIFRNSVSLSSIKDPKEACKIAYCLWRNKEFEDSKYWYLYATKLLEHTKMENSAHYLQNVYRVLGSLATRSTWDGHRVVPTGTLPELLYQLKYWLLSIKACDDIGMGSTTKRKQEQTLKAILYCILHNKKITVDTLDEIIRVTHIITKFQI